MKRFFDLIVSLTLIIFLAIFFLLISFIIKLDSKGPVFFRQKRLGLNNKIFTIFKFRTMHKDTEKYALSPTSKDDKRITRVGKFLRLTSIDELPNLFNVFIGDMSIVGPRAIDKKQFELRRFNCIKNNPEKKEYYDEMFSKRHIYRPGITGLTQISGRSNMTPEQSIEYDIKYINKANIFYDIKIILLTVYYVVTRKGVN